ncbi:MAG: cupin domain-containing protein [Cellvibrionaceae bacterium]|nr:cupin domain-containing protein [Cellvibrionaceae bacterium]
MSHKLSQLGDISVEQFLSEYWQQKPLLIRQALSGFETPLSPDEMAGLSLEEEIESRIVLESHQDKPWQLLKGPFEETLYQELPDRNWTLLLQALDLYIPELKDLREKFQFLPDWRLDDVMASFAVDGGSVGPHYDHYDVFLLQGYGKRHWQIGQSCNEDSAQLAGTPLNILQEFQCLESHILEPGDILYLPPKVAHWGIAQGDCITYSVGFRAPSQAQLIEEHFQSLAEGFSEFQRYQDPSIKTRPHSHELLGEDIKRVQDILLERLKSSPEEIAQWFGRMLSETKYCNEAGLTETPSEMPEYLVKASETRCLFFRKQDGSAELFVNGEQLHCPVQVAIDICEQDTLICQDVIKLFEEDEAGLSFIQQLISLAAYNEDQDDY